MAGGWHATTRSRRGGGRLGPARGPRRHGRHRRRDRRSALRVPDAREVPRRPEAHRPPGRSTEELRRGYPEMPATGPAFRPEQHRFAHEFPFYGSGRSAGCACIPRSSTSWSARSRPTDLRVYQTQISAKYAGDANFEQPMHTDRNHSFLPPRMEPPWWHVESFLYLSDVDEGTAPTHLVPRRDSVGRSTNSIFMPDGDPELYAERARRRRSARIIARLPPRRVPSGRRSHAPGKPSLLVERELQGRGQRLDRIPLARSRTRRIRRGCSSSRRRRRGELELFGFPPPGHPGMDGRTGQRDGREVSEARRRALAARASSMTAAGTGRRSWTMPTQLSARST